MRRQLAAAIAGKDVGVHQARVASRRLREALPVLSAGLPHSKAGKAQRKIRRLTQALGAVRELDVTLHLVDEMSEKPGVPRPALAEVRALVIEDRERRREVMLQRLKSVDTDKLTHRLAAVRQALLHPGPGHTWRAALALRIVKRARRLDKAIDHAGQIYAPEPLHQVRIAAKKLRYSLELADESGAAPCGETLRVIKRIQDALGRLHDLQVLLHHVAAVGAAPRGRRSTPDAGLAVLSRQIEDECRHLHGRYVSQLPRLRDAVEAARRDVPLRLTRRRSTRAIKMDLAAKRRAAGKISPAAKRRAASGQR